MRFAEIVKLLAAPAARQIAFLGDFPENAAVDGFTKFNPAYRMAILYLDSVGVVEGDGGSEGEANWLARTQFPRDALTDRRHPLVRSLPWLTIAMRMLMELDKPRLFCRHGLRSAHEWRLVRRLAGEVCQAMDWPLELRYQTFDELWRELGGGVIDESGDYAAQGK